MATAAHASLQRLLDYARKVSAGTSFPVKDWPELQVALDVSAQVLNNWKRRGLSKEGALRAEAEFGCSANWLLTGEGPQGKPHLRSAARLGEPEARYDRGPADVLDSLRLLLASVPDGMLDSFVDILSAWARTGGTDSHRRRALLSLVSIPTKQPRAANN